MVPSHINELELVPDPANRSGHWYHPATDTVLSLGSDYRPPHLREALKAEVTDNVAESAQPAAETAKPAPDTVAVVIAPVPAGTDDVKDPLPPTPVAPAKPEPSLRQQLLIEAEALGVKGFKRLSASDLQAAINKIKSEMPLSDTAKEEPATEESVTVPKEPADPSALVVGSVVEILAGDFKGSIGVIFYEDEATEETPFTRTILISETGQEIPVGAEIPLRLLTDEEKNDLEETAKKRS